MDRDCSACPRLRLPTKQTISLRYLVARTERPSTATPECTGRHSDIEDPRMAKVARTPLLWLAAGSRSGGQLLRFFGGSSQCAECEPTESAVAQLLNRPWRPLSTT